ncbi:YjfB family protein [Paenibacillus sp. 1P07SE]|uniref:YjfB family protein n=1 Tax=Paenibacillus sp. 1P07SE TaxID=3132209 RepID=UPI0039A5D228
MDIAALSIAMNQSSIKQFATIATMKMAMNTANVNAEGTIDMLNQMQAMAQSVQPHLGSSIDIKV